MPKWSASGFGLLSPKSPPGRCARLCGKSGLSFRGGIANGRTIAAIRANPPSLPVRFPSIPAVRLPPMFKIFKRCLFFALKVFGVCLLVLFSVLFWQETLKNLKQQRLRKIYDHAYGRKSRQRFQPPYDKEKARVRKLCNEWFELQKQRFYQRQEELREEFSAQIEQMRNQTNRKDTL
jgi:hypothetical protein